MLMLSKIQAKNRINQLIRKDNATDNQSNRYYAECMAFIASHLVAFYKQYANANGLSLNQTATLVNSWDMNQWKQAINSLDIDNFPDEAKMRIAAYGKAAGINRTHMMSNIAKVGLVAFAVKELRMAQKRIKQDGIDQVHFLKRPMKLNEKQVQKAYSFVTDPKRQAIWSRNLWSDTDQLADEVEQLVNHHLKHGMRLDKLESILEAHANPDQFKSDSIAYKVHKMEFNARRIVRTESANLVNHVNRATYRQVGVTLVAWVNESGACDKCVAIAEGGPYQLDDSPIPPDSSHPNCRCTLIPVGTRFQRFITYIKSI